MPSDAETPRPLGDSLPAWGERLNDLSRAPVVMAGDKLLTFRDGEWVPFPDKPPC